MRQTVNKSPISPNTHRFSWVHMCAFIQEGFLWKGLVARDWVQACVGSWGA